MKSIDSANGPIIGVHLEEFEEDYFLNETDPYKGFYSVSKDHTDDLKGVIGILPKNGEKMEYIDNDRAIFVARNWEHFSKLLDRRLEIGDNVRIKGKLYLGKPYITHKKGNSYKLYNVKGTFKARELLYAGSRVDKGVLIYLGPVNFDLDTVEIDNDLIYEVLELPHEVEGVSNSLGLGTPYLYHIRSIFGGKSFYIDAAEKFVLLAESLDSLQSRTSKPILLNRTITVRENPK